MIKPIVITDEKREGRGFSLKEIKEAKIDIQRARKLGFLVDRRRKTAYDENIKKLKELLKPAKKKPVKKKLVKKEIKKVEKPIKKEAKEKKVKKKAEEPKKKVAKPKKKAVKEKKIKEIALTEVKGLGKKTAEQLENAGIKSANKLLSLNTKKIVEKTGISEKKIEKLKESAKEVL
jgi:large subunit ribosomal protein L13e